MISKNDSLKENTCNVSAGFTQKSLMWLKTISGPFWARGNASEKKPWMQYLMHNINEYSNRIGLREFIH